MPRDLSHFPEPLLARAVFMAGEPAWPAEAARDVVIFLQSIGLAVLGIEFWQPEGDVPRVLGWSVYHIPFTGDWAEYVRANASSALAETEADLASNAVLNLTWASEDEIRRPPFGDLPLDARPSE